MRKIRGLLGLVLAGAVALAMTFGAPATAEAGFKRFHHDLGFHSHSLRRKGFRRFRHRRVHFGFGHRRGLRGCYIYKAKWKATGRYDWKKRYFACRRWR